MVQVPCCQDRGASAVLVVPCYWCLAGSAVLVPRYSLEMQRPQPSQPRERWRERVGASRVELVGAAAGRKRGVVFTQRALGSGVREEKDRVTKAQCLEGVKREKE